MEDENWRKNFFEKCIKNEEFVTLHPWSKNFFDPLKIKTPVGTFDPLHIFASFNGFGMSEEDLQRLISGGYVSDDEIGKRPFSKLVKDISEELRLI